MNENIREFYDYLRYAMSMAQYKLPAIVIEDIKNNLSAYLDKMNNEELENVRDSLDSYDDYYLKSCNLFEDINKGISESPYSKEISSAFADPLNNLSANLERLDFIRNFVASINDLVDAKIIHQVK